MKIAIVTDDGNTVSRHFGRATNYKVFNVEDGSVTSTEMRAKPGHNDFQHDSHAHAEGSGHPHGHGPMAQHNHGQMAAVISDCQVLICGGMGSGAFEHMQSLGITTIITEHASIDDAMRAFLDGSIVNHTERLH